MESQCWPSGPAALQLEHPLRSTAGRDPGPIPEQNMEPLLTLYGVLADPSHKGRQKHIYSFALGLIPVTPCLKMTAGALKPQGLP